MPSFKTVLRRIHNVWTTRRGDLAEQARPPGCVHCVRVACGGLG